MAAIWHQAASSLCAYLWIKAGRAGHKQGAPPHPPAARPADSAASFHTAASASRTLHQAPGGRPEGPPAAGSLLRVYIGLGLDPLLAAQWLSCVQGSQLSPHCLEQRSPYRSPRGPERKLERRSQARPPSPASLWLTWPPAPPRAAARGGGTGGSGDGDWNWVLGALHPGLLAMVLFFFFFYYE